MGYDAIRDSWSSGDAQPSPSPTSSKRGIAMLLNEEPVPPSPVGIKRPLRYDPIHHPDLPSPVEMARPSSSSSNASGYFSMSGTPVDTSPATKGLALPTKVQSALHNQHLSSFPHHSTSSSPTLPTRPLSSTSNSLFTPQASPNLPARSAAPSSSSYKSMPPPISIPYNPRPRITPPKSVAIPITPQELERLRKSHRNPLRTPEEVPNHSSYNPNADELVASTSQTPWSPSRQNEPLSIQSETLTRGVKRKADSSIDLESNESKRGNAALVASHYNSRPEVGIARREDSPIIGLKSFNNWIKAVMIAKFARPAIQETNSRPEGLEYVGSMRRPKFTARVLDLGCGKGGDLIKWSKAEIKQYVGVDIAAVSVEQARSRWMERQGQRKVFDAEFFDSDCFSFPLSERIPANILQQPFDVVSMQFCMHYAFETEEKVKMMLHNVTSYLRPGGVFFGTVPNSKPMLRRLKKIPADGELSFGNGVYSIRFEERQGPGKHLYGHKYWFWLKDAVDVPEYVIVWDAFVQLAATHGLELIYKKDFHTIYAEEQETTEFKQLLQTMRVVDRKGESALDQDQWEAANIYLGFVFKKREPHV